MLLAAVLFAAVTPVSTRCQAVDVTVLETVIDRQLIGCGEGFPDNLLWHLDRADSFEGTLDEHAVRRATGRGAVVYVADTGVWRDHDELVRADGSIVIAQLDPAASIGLEPVKCSDGTTRVDPCYSTPTTLALYTHGTAVASVIAGKTTGVAPDAKIVSVRTAANKGPTMPLFMESLRAIIRHAFEPTTPPFHTAVVNISGGLNLGAPEIEIADFENLMRAMIGGVDREGHPDPAGKRFLFVVAAGNAAEPTTKGGNRGQCDPNGLVMIHPGVLGSSIDGLITVGGSTAENRLWPESCVGEAIDILAPAEHMLCASISGHDHYRGTILLKDSSGNVRIFDGASGTSYSTAYVSGLAACLLERNPDLTPVEIERALKAGASLITDPSAAPALGRVAIYDVLSAIPRHRAAHH